MEPLGLVVDIAEVRRALDVALGCFEEAAQVVIEKDFYWSIPPEERFNPYEPPVTMTMGSLADLIEYSSALSSEPGSVTKQHLVWLGELLRSIGELAPD